MTTILDSGQVVARKDHRCHWCGEIIEKGSKYEKYSCVFEGSIQTVKMHSECYRASLEYFRGEGRYEEGFDYGSFARGSVYERE